jgi:peptidylprolyl isomerase/FKBP-type peptidyl-prolyl cis-trans isomerase FkpA
MNKNYLFVTIFLVILVVVGGIAIFAKSPSKKMPLATSTPAGTIEATAEPIATNSASPAFMQTDKLIIQDEVVGTGAEAVAGKSVTVNYVGTLTDGTTFDSSYSRNQPFTFNLGAGEVIQGWDQGVVGMKVGGKRKLTIPPSLGYGAQAVGSIPPNSTLIFEVELLKVE